MNKKSLAVELSKLKKFENVKAGLEQYPSDSELAAHILWNAFMNGDIEGKIVADLGCGNGIFGIGALMLGAKHVYFVDVDGGALVVARENCEFEGGEFLDIDIFDFDKKVDTVVMNPPFGVQNKHIDRSFLEVAMQFANSIYTIHKVETKEFIDSFVAKGSFEVVGFEEKDFVLKKSMKFHKSEKYNVRVGIWMLKRKL
jgi:putative methylase